jgi:hypothetical protein
MAEENRIRRSYTQSLPFSWSLLSFLIITAAVFV